MQEIASELGLSRLTVSSVINNKARERGISEETEGRVRNHLERIGYVPSRGARNLRAGETGDVTGLLFSGHLYSHLTEAFLTFSQKLSTGQSSWLETVLLPPERQVEGLREMLARRVSRMVWLHADADYDEIRNPRGMFPLLRRFDRVVVYNYRYGFGQYEERLRDVGADLVGVDRRSSFQQLAHQLSELEHRHVGLWFAGAGEKIGAAMEEEALDVSVFTETGWDYEEMAQKIAAWVAPNTVANRGQAAASPMTAVCVGNDQVAGHLIRELIDRGMHIPGDMSVIGWSGEQVASAFAVPLATLEVPVDRMVSQTLSLLSGESVDGGERYLYRAELAHRSSLGQVMRER